MAKKSEATELAERLLHPSSLTLRYILMDTPSSPCFAFPSTARRVTTFSLCWFPAGVIVGEELLWLDDVRKCIARAGVVVSG